MSHGQERRRPEGSTALDQVQGPHEIPTVALATDIDELGHVNNLVYVRWVQDAAESHWRALSTPEEFARVSWVVVRHEIDYLHPARVDDEIRLRTWVGVATKTTYERHTEILRAADSRILAVARTLWCPVDPRTLRVIRIEESLRARVSSPS